MRVILFVLFQAAWFGIILLGSFWGLIITFFYLSSIQWLVKPKPVFWLWTFGIAAFGFGVDGLLTALGIYQFSSLYPPLWLACLWCIFIPIVPLALDWMFRHKWLPPLAGFIAGPLTYQGGSLMTDMHIQSSFYLIETAVAWFLIMLVLIYAFPHLKRSAL